MKNNRQKELEKFVDSAAEQQLGIELGADQRRFLRLIKERGVCVKMSKRAKRNKGFQELVGLLADMHKKGIIPVFQTIEI
jgi:hypothetical protein